MPRSHVQKRSCVLKLVERFAMLLLVTPALGLALAAANSSETFFDALTNPDVTVIEIPPDNFKLRPEDWAAFNRTHPYVLDRHVLMRSAAPPELGQMDFQFLMRKVLLAPNITLTLERLVLLNVNKLGGFGLDFFMGDTGSVIRASDSVRVKLVCPPADQSLQAAQAFSAPEGSPPNNVSLKSGVCIAPSKGQIERKCYDDAVFFEDFALQVSTVDPDAGISQAGYRLVMHNVSRVCENYITAECIRQSSEDLCTAQLLSTLLALPADDNGWRPQAIAGVVIGAVVGFIAACCLAGYMLWKHRHWWRNGNGNGDGTKGPAGAAEPGRTARQDSTSELRRQLLHGTGGQRSDSQAPVKLGVLLGSGSFGRVFKGRWHGMDVAVKVMDPCSPDTLPKVLREAEVMMGLNHPNIVKAYQCSVWSKKQQEQMLQAAQAAQQRQASEPGAQQRRWQLRPQQPTGGRQGSISSASPHSSTTASQAASSSSTAADLQPQPTSTSAAAASSDNVVINIVPEIIPRNRQPLAVVTAAGVGAPASIGTTSASSSSTAAAALSTSSTAAAAAAGKPAGTGGATEPSESSASAARRMFNRLWRHQQQQTPPELQGPPTGSTGQEPPRVPATPLSSAAFTMSGCSSMDVTATGTSSHTAAGAISSTQPHVGSFAIIQTAAAAPQSGRTVGSSTSTGPGTGSGMLSSTALTLSVAGRSSASGASASQGESQAAGEIRPYPAGRSSSSGGVQGVSHSGSSGDKPGSPGGARISEGGSSSQEAQDEMQVWLVLELCTGGSLRDAVSCGRLKTTSVQDMAKLLSRLLDAANGLAYLHNQGVVHGDLKAANVLLQHSVQGTYGQVAKVSDFGVSARLLDGATHRSTASLGTITHVAPEVLSSGRLSKAADVYAFGIMMFEVFTNQTAYAGCHSGAIVERVVIRGERPPVPRSMPPQYALLMQRCWAADPEERPSFEQVIACLELLLDNLTSSDDEGVEGHISEGVEEEHTTTSSSSSSKGGDGSGAQDKQAADKAAAAGVAAAAEAAAEAAAPAVAGELVKPSLTGPPQAALGSPSHPQGPWEGASTPGASSSRGGGRFSWPLGRGSDKAGGSRQQKQGLAESVEGSCDTGTVSGPSTPGFHIELRQLLGMRQWYGAHAESLAASQEPDLEAGLPVGCGSAASGAALSLTEDLGSGIVPFGSSAAVHRAAYRARRLVQPWLDGCDAAPTPPRQEQQRVSRQPWGNMGRWLWQPSAEKGSAAAQRAAAQAAAAGTNPVLPQ